jgi:phosphopentomutase
MSRVLVCELDSLGVGAAHDADKFGDQGADTLGHIAEACAAGEADRDGMRSGPLHIPNLVALGMGALCEASTGRTPPGLHSDGPYSGAWGYAIEQSHGKDTPSGHWEAMGAPATFDWGYFNDATNSFPPKLVNALIEQADLPGVLANCHASGTEIIKQYGEEHIKSGKPILYTSADSVVQIAAHEGSFGLERLYEVCKIARVLADEYNIGRVIARPFEGTGPADFNRTHGRRDYSVLPHKPTLLNRVSEAGHEVIAIGKISDIFAGSGVTQKVPAYGNDAIFDTTLKVMQTAPDNSFIMTNFVDFDMLFGHRRDVPGYAAALEAFDKRLPELNAALREDDLVVLTADHGCDPTFPGSDHTRENVPVLAFGPKVKAGPLGARSTFADIGETAAKWLGVEGFGTGRSWL